MNKYQVEYTDTFAGEANYSWVKRAVVAMPELTTYGYDGCTNYAAANKRYTRELMRRAKAVVGLTGTRGRRESWGDCEVFRPYGSATILFVSWHEGE
jgi:hypothetical protein